MSRERLLNVRVLRLDHSDDLPLPAYQSAGAAGLDLLAAIPADAAIVLQPNARELIPTGLAIELPQGFEAQVRPRSGLALKHGITVLNSPGTIDCDYRGEIKVLLINLGESPFAIARGERIAQMIVAPVMRLQWDEVTALGDSERGTGGYGSTGTAATRR